MANQDPAVARCEALQALVDDAEESGLYDVSAEEYYDAIRVARHEIAEERAESGLSGLRP